MSDSRIHRMARGILAAATLLAILIAPCLAGPATDSAPTIPTSIANQVPKSFILNPFDMPVSPAPDGSEYLAPLLGVNIHFTRDDRGLDAARRAGFAWVRMDLIWAQIETSRGVYNFSEYDRLLTALKARGMRALLILDYGNALYTGGANQPPVTAASIKAFGNFAEAAARHFAGHGVRYEIWNEPNNVLFWPPEPDAGQFADLAADATARIHAGDPSAAVSTGGLAGMDRQFLFDYLLDGGASGANAIGCHPYRTSAPETAIDDVLLWRLIISQIVSHNPPSWVTEWGYSSTWFGNGHTPTARTRQAVMATREILTSWLLGFPMIIYYDLRDDGANGSEVEHNFGLLTQNYFDKPAMQAVCTLSTAASGRQFIGQLALGSASLYAMRLDSASDILVALWTDDGQATILVAPGTTAFSMLGDPLTLTSTGNQLACQVTEAVGPVYLLFPRAQPSPQIAKSGTVVADYDGDAKADPAHFAPATGSWTIWLSGVGYTPTTVQGFLGQAGDVAAVADYDGDAKPDPAIYRPSTETLIARLSADLYRPKETPLATGALEVKPVPADYDGDAKADAALYVTTGQWVIWLTSKGQAPFSLTQFDTAGAEPIAADFDGDGKADPACCSADGFWWTWLSGKGYAANGPFDLGLPNAIPVAADFDGDNFADPGAIVSGAAWHVWLSSERYRHFGPIELKP